MAPGRTQRDAQQARRRHGDGDDVHLHPRMERQPQRFQRLPAPGRPRQSADGVRAARIRRRRRQARRLLATARPRRQARRRRALRRRPGWSGGARRADAARAGRRRRDLHRRQSRRSAGRRSQDFLFSQPKRPGQRHRPPDRLGSQPVSDQGRQSALHHRCGRTRRGADVQAGRARERDRDLGRPRRRAHCDVDRLRARPFSAFGACQRHTLPGRTRRRRRRTDFVRPDPRDRAADGRDRVVRSAAADVGRHRGGGSRRGVSRLAPEIVAPIRARPDADQRREVGRERPERRSARANPDLAHRPIRRRHCLSVRGHEILPSQSRGRTCEWRDARCFR